MRPLLPALAGGTLVWLITSARVIALVRDPSDRWVAAVPDDAFYYFQLARNAVRQHSWTFDGTAPATGFQPLYAYLLALLHVVAGDLDGRTLLLTVGLVSAVAFGVSCSLMSALTTRLFGATAVPWTVALFVAPTAVVQVSFLMESWLVCLFAALFLLVVTRPTRPTVATIVGLIVLGVLGSLSRSDFGVLPAAMVVGFLAVARGRIRLVGLWRSGLVLGGASFGVVLIAGHNVLLSGQVLQASVRVKAYWASVLPPMPGSPSTPGDSLEAPFAILTRLFTQVLPTSDTMQPHAVAWALAWSALGIGTAWLVMRLVRAGALPPLCSPAVVGCLAASAAYVVVYSRDGEVQLWYATSFLVPCSLLLAALGRGAFGSHVLIPGIVLATVAASVSTVTLTWVPYPNQIALLRAGIALHDAPVGDTVGAWDAGIIGFTSDRGIVNLDGLVNDDAAAYVLRDDLAGYVRHRELKGIVDYRSMIDSPWARARGGYADGRLIACLGTPTASYDGRGLDPEHTVLLRQVRPGCL